MWESLRWLTWESHVLFCGPDWPSWVSSVAGTSLLCCNFSLLVYVKPTCEASLLSSCPQGLCALAQNFGLGFTGAGRTWLQTLEHSSLVLQGWREPFTAPHPGDQLSWSLYFLRWYSAQARRALLVNKANQFSKPRCF